MSDAKLFSQHQGHDFLISKYHWQPGQHIPENLDKYQIKLKYTDKEGNERWISTPQASDFGSAASSAAGLAMDYGDDTDDGYEEYEVDTFEWLE